MKEKLVWKVKTCNPCNPFYQTPSTSAYLILEIFAMQMFFFHILIKDLSSAESYFQQSGGGRHPSLSSAVTL